MLALGAAAAGLAVSVFVSILKRRAGASGYRCPHCVVALVSEDASNSQLRCSSCHAEYRRVGGAILPHKARDAAPPARLLGRHAPPESEPPR
jgi:hypothetical protein